MAGSGFMVDSVLPEHGAPSIRGSVSGVRAVVDFRSGKDPQASGRGELVLKDGGLHWKRFEGRGDHLFPVSQVLQPAQGFLEKAREFRRRRFPHEKAPSSGAGSSATAKRGESAR